MRSATVLLLLAIVCVGCTGALREKTLASRRERAARTAPAWVAIAKKNKELGETAYAQLVAAAPKRAAGEPLTVFYWLDDTQVAAEFLREAPPGTRRSYLGDVHIRSMNTSLGMFERSFALGLATTTIPAMRVFSRGSGGICAQGPSWYETMRDCRVEADVFLWIKVEITAQPNCPDGRGYHVTARWTSAYQRQDFGFELDFCRRSDEGAALLAAKILPQIDVDTRPLLPALAEAESITPGIRYDWWLYEVDNKGGGSSFGSFD